MCNCFDLPFCNCGKSFWKRKERERKKKQFAIMRYCTRQAKIWFAVPFSLKFIPHFTLKRSQLKIKYWEVLMRLFPYLTLLSWLISNPVTFNFNALYIFISSCLYQLFHQITSLIILYFFTSNCNSPLFYQWH